MKKSIEKMTGSEINGLNRVQISDDLKLVIFPDTGLVQLMTGRYKRGVHPEKLKMGIIKFLDPDLDFWYWIRLEQDPFIDLTADESKQISDLLNIDVDVEIEQLLE